MQVRVRLHVRQAPGWSCCAPPERARLRLKGRTHIILLKDQIAIRTLRRLGRAGAGFFEIDLVGHEGSNASGDFCHTPTITAICEAHGHHLHPGRRIARTTPATSSRRMATWCGGRSVTGVREENPYRAAKCGEDLLQGPQGLRKIEQQRLYHSCGVA